jgi:hypothetical protein
MCWHILAINHEDEISVHSRGSKKHNHEFLPHTTQLICLCGALQCKESFPHPTIMVSSIEPARIIQKCQHTSNTLPVDIVFAGECIPYHCHVWDVFYLPLHGSDLAETADGCL